MIVFKKAIIWTLILCVISIPVALARDTSSLESSLVGHWITKSKATDYYFDGSNLLMVERSGRIMPMTYKNLEYNEKYNWLKISVLTNYNKGHEKLLEFLDKDRTIINETIEMEFAGKKSSLSTIWYYVDDQTRP